MWIIGTGRGRVRTGCADGREAGRCRSGGGREGGGGSGSRGGGATGGGGSGVMGTGVTAVTVWIGREASSGTVPFLVGRSSLSVGCLSV